MAIESVQRAVSELETAITNGNHLCDITVEESGDRKMVHFHIDADPENDDPVATLTFTMPPSEEDIHPEPQADAGDEPPADADTE